MDLRWLAVLALVVACTSHAVPPKPILAAPRPAETPRTLELAVRDNRGWLDATSGGTATDIGQFATARVVWQPGGVP